MPAWVIFLLLIFTVIVCLNIYGFIGFFCYGRRRWFINWLLCVNCFPIYCIWSLCKSQPVRRLVVMPRKKSRPPKYEQMELYPANRLFRNFNCMLSCIFHNSPIGCNFTKSLSVNEAICRYAEQPPIKLGDLIDRLKENKFLDLVLNLLNGQNANFFFKVLPSGSLREGYGKPLPSTSTLGTDYDLMLIPDGIEVAESIEDSSAGSSGNGNPTESKSDLQQQPKRLIENSGTSRGKPGKVAPLFETMSDPDQNPETPTGFVRLKLLDTTMESWNRLCFDRITTNGVEKFLSQINVYNQIRGAIDGTIGRSLMFDISYKVQDLKIICKRNGPAFTITVEKEAEIKELTHCVYGELEEELFHCDFTFALYCPTFPRCAQEQKSQTFLAQGVALEFRYSFSQAEIILSDEIPDRARTTFLAFKGTIKKVVNYVCDGEGEFHRIPSYVLKTILFRQTETKRESYWNMEDVLETFFLDLLHSLQNSITSRCCPMYWNPEINLLQDMNEQDFTFISNRLQFINDNMVEAIADDWLELERCVRLNCCKWCLDPTLKVNFIEEDVKRQNCRLVPCRFINFKLWETMQYDENTVYVY